MPRLTLEQLPYSFKVDASVEAVAPARRRVHELVKGLGLSLGSHALDDLELLASELVTNSVAHTNAPCVVCVRWTGQRIRVEVTDAIQSTLEVKHPGPEAENGRGLLLVEMIAAAWGSHLEPAGKTTWFEVADDARPEVPQAPPAGTYVTASSNTVADRQPVRPSSIDRSRGSAIASR